MTFCSFKREDLWRWQNSALIFVIGFVLLSPTSIAEKCIGGIMVSMLTSTVVDHGFEPRSGKTKDN